MRCGPLGAAVLSALALAAVAPAAGHAAPPLAAPVAGKDETRTARHLESIRFRPAQVRAFLEAMPKGADLHNHLSGAVATETLVGLAATDGLCIDTITLTAMPAPAVAGTACPVGQRPAADWSSDREFFERMLRAWSMKDFAPGGTSGHDHFFATFGKFGAATERKGDMLAAVARDNARQHVHYLETLVSRQSGAVRTLATRVGFERDFAALRAKLIAGGMGQIVAAARAETDADFARRDALLGCGTPQAEAGCRVTIRLDYQVGRATSPEIVFTNLLLGFELQRSDPRYVGVNLVQPEDNPIALRDYTLQMRMIRYLRNAYPGTRVTLHAGELAPGLVAPADLRFHIRQAVQVAGARRIGHGVSIMHEHGARRLIAEMARRDVLVEVPLTSNRQILRVSGRAHPFMRLLAAGVPVALATDDAGVSRIDLTHEYQYALAEYHLSYSTLKRLSRTSAEHAFIRGASLWRSPGVFRRTRSCARDVPGAGTPRRACRALLARSAKASLQWNLERALRSFERRRGGRTG